MCVCVNAMERHGGTRWKRRWTTAIVAALVIGVAFIAPTAQASEDPFESCTADQELDWGTTYVTAQASAECLGCEVQQTDQAAVLGILTFAWTACAFPDCYAAPLASAVWSSGDDVLVGFWAECGDECAVVAVVTGDVDSLDADGSQSVDCKKVVLQVV